MAEISYRRHRFPPVLIQHAVWLYLRFTLSYRDVEDLLAEHGLDISHETIQSWVLKFRPVIARRLRRSRPRRAADSIWTTGSSALLALSAHHPAAGSDQSRREQRIAVPVGGWQMPPAAAQKIAKMAPILAPFQQTPIIVTGYTDNVPIGPELR